MFNQDQQQEVRSINLAPGYVHIFNASSVLAVNPIFRQDQVNTFPVPILLMTGLQRSVRIDG